MAKNNEITVVISSRNSGDEMQQFIDLIKNTAGCQIKILFITNQGNMGLAELYGGILQNKSIESDIIVFIHDDIEPLRSGWGAEILRLFKKYPKYGIIGIAGSDRYDPNVYGWWSHKGHTWGQVLHRSNGKSWLTCFSDLIENDIEEVCVIDGLFMAINRKKISKNFDKKFMWHGYDIDFCLANYLDGKCKIGVTTNVRIAHNSTGPTNDEWKNSMKYIEEKYEDELPIEVIKPKKRA